MAGFEQGRNARCGLFGCQGESTNFCLPGAPSSLRIARPESSPLWELSIKPRFSGKITEIQGMYAVIKSGGKQHRVQPGEVLQLEKLDVAEGETVDFDEVMLIGDGDNVQIGTPFVEGGKVVAEVIKQGRGDKITIIKMKRRKHYRRQAGHRQYLTSVRIKEITGAN